MLCLKNETKNDKIDIRKKLLVIFFCYTHVCVFLFGLCLFFLFVVFICAFVFCCLTVAFRLASDFISR